MPSGVYTSKLYEDTGCYLSPSCLSCPFPECFEGHPERFKAWRMEQDSMHLMALMEANDLSAIKAGKTLRFSRAKTYELLKLIRESK